MKTYELADMLAVIDTVVQGHAQMIPSSFGGFILHHSGIWLWFDETKNLTNTEKTQMLESVGLRGATGALHLIDGEKVWGIGPDAPLMPIPFTLEQLQKFDEVSRKTISESIQPLNDEDFSSTLIGVSASEVARFLLFGEVPTDEAVPVQTATPVPLVAGNEPVKLVNGMKKAALIAALEYEWPSIEADIREATRNELKAAAHTEMHGVWDKDKARAWAVSKGKIKQSSTVQSLASAWPGTTTRHTISG